MNKKTISWIALVAVLFVLAGLFAVYWKSRPKLVALTFDDGPSPYTEALLDGLKARNVPATFFMNGENGTGGSCGIKNGHEALLSRMWEEGHQLANHTYQHTVLDELPAEQIVDEVTGVENLIFDAVGGSYECFVRTPGGHVNEVIANSVNAPIIRWSVDTEDWKYRNAEYVYNKLLASVESGSIVLMHDIYETSVEGTLRAVDTLKEQGYEFVTVSELMRRTGTQLTNGEAYSRTKDGIVLHQAYMAPEVTVSKEDSSGHFEITCSISAGLTVYYTMDGSYPKLSDHTYNGTILAEAGTVFTAVGVDRWGTRTPAAAITVGANDG